MFDPGPAALLACFRLARVKPEWIVKLVQIDLAVVTADH